MLREHLSWKETGNTDGLLKVASREETNLVWEILQDVDEKGEIKIFFINVLMKVTFECKVQQLNLTLYLEEKYKVDGCGKVYCKLKK